MLWQAFKTTRSGGVFYISCEYPKNQPELCVLTLFSTHTGTVSHAVTQNKFQVPNKKKKLEEPSEQSEHVSANYILVHLLHFFQLIPEN